MTHSTPYRLYWEALSGAIAPEMLLTELGLSFDRVFVDMAAGEHKTPQYLALNPTGQVPALRMPDGTIIGESAAIVLAIGDRHPESPMVPKVGDADRPIFLYWLLYMATSMYMAFVRSNHPERFTTEIGSNDSIRDAALDAIDRQFGVIDQAIHGEPFFLARGFGALDMYLAMLTLWYPDRNALFSRHRKVGGAVNAVLTRPACAHIMEEHLAHA